jgi:hypothetical protein
MSTSTSESQLDRISAREWQSGITYGQGSKAVLYIDGRMEAYASKLERKYDFCLFILMVANSVFRLLELEQQGTHDKLVIATSF